MTCKSLGIETDKDFKVFKITAYDKDCCRTLEMTCDEGDLRESLKHKPESFTFDECDKRFHEYVLERLRLIPGHDNNNDGFLNEDDVRRDDLTFSLVAEGRWKPIKVMSEIGAKAKLKRKELRKELKRSERDMAKSLEEERARLLAEGSLNGEQMAALLQSPSERARSTFVRPLSAGDLGNGLQPNHAGVSGQWAQAPQKTEVGKLDIEIDKDGEVHMVPHHVEDVYANDFEEDE